MKRRDFLSGAVGTAWMVNIACRSTQQQQATSLPRPSMEELKAAAAKPVLNVQDINSPVIIDSIQVFQKDRDQFVYIRSKDGAEGISVTNRRPYLIPILKELIVPFLIGKDARQWETQLMWELYRYRSNYKLQGLAFWTPHAWVEFAILDMLGRISGKSIGELLGGVVRREVAHYIASHRRDTTPEEEVDYLQELLAKSGARAVKFRVGGRMSRNQDAAPGRTERLIPLVRKTLGHEIDIHADANSSYDPEHAIRVGRLLEEVNAIFFEEPCPFDHLLDTKVVTDALHVPVAGGEQEYSQWRFMWQIHEHVVDVVQPDLHYYGGLIRSKRVANMAELASIPTTVHISGGFGFVYMLHFASCTKDIGPYQEYKFGVETYGDWFDPPLKIQNNKITVPSGPGVGIKDIQAVLSGAQEV